MTISLCPAFVLHTVMTLSKMYTRTCVGPVTRAVWYKFHRALCALGHRPHPGAAVFSRGVLVAATSRRAADTPRIISKIETVPYKLLKL